MMQLDLQVGAGRHGFQQYQFVWAVRPHVHQPNLDIAGDADLDVTFGALAFDEIKLGRNPYIGVQPLNGQAAHFLLQKVRGKP